MSEGNDGADRQVALALVPVSRETEERLALYVERLREWQRIKNLVAPSTLDRIWSRHIADSAQLLALAPEARHWVDLGSGAGFPGLVIAILLAQDARARVDLVESNARKCAFLRDVVRATGAPARVHAERIEAVLPTLTDVEVVTSRALAPLPHLIDYARKPLSEGATGLFLVGEEPAAVDPAWPFEVEVIPSRTHADARILRVHAISVDRSS